MALEPPLLAREPGPLLRPFVSALWTVDQRGVRTPAPVERVLPTGETHLAIRLTDDPVRIFEGAAGAASIGSAVVGGARCAAYLKDVSRPSWSLGAQLRPGAAQALFGAPAGELAGRHTDLALLWGRAVDDLRERAAGAPTAEARLRLLEAALTARLPPIRGIHPAVAQALLHFRRSSEVRPAVAASGIGHRRFIELFREQVGLAPKVFCRVRRFQRALRLAARDPLRSWAAVAADAGYSDQPHLHREFIEFAGVTPGDYRSLAPAFPNHVPILPPSR
jgi:AraC-like DNA-binding protein